MLSPLNQDIIDTFKKNFSSIKKEQIALYGVGDKTRLILENITDYNFLGLMDQAKTGEFIYGKKVLDKQEIIKKIKYIIIICNYSSASLIFNRIKYLANDYDIKIFHLNGTDMTRIEAQKNNKISSINYDDIVSLMEQYDVISFDIFDTLIMRKCLIPEDVFYIVEKIYCKKRNNQLKFAEERKKAEKEVYIKKGNCGKIEDIYEILKGKLNLNESSIFELMELEISIELNLSAVREDVLNLLRYAKTLKRKVIIVSDMYLSSEVIQLLLEKNGIVSKDYDQLYLSCEAGKCKEKGDLWELIKNNYEKSSILHIGDNAYSDGEQAKKKGIDSYILTKAYDELTCYSLCDLNNKNNTLGNHLILGIFAANALNEVFIKDKRKINSLYDVGNIFFGPIVNYYLQYIKYIMEKYKLQQLIFLARDGYILESIYQSDPSLCSIPAYYFLTSRCALAGSSMYEEKDISFVYNLFALGSKYYYEEFMNIVFGIKPLINDKYIGMRMQILEKNELYQHIIDVYFKDILEKSSLKRKNYKQYAKNIGLSEGKRTGVINFIGSGVTQSLFEKIFLENDNYFIYLANTLQNITVNLNSPVLSAFSEKQSIYTSEKNSLIKYMVSGECIFTSPQSQFMYFENNDEAIFALDGKNKMYERVRQCHQGIKKYIENFKGLNSIFNYEDFDENIIQSIYGNLYSEEIFEIDSNIKKSFCLDDIITTEKICPAWLE